MDSAYRKAYCNAPRQNRPITIQAYDRNEIGKYLAHWWTGAQDVIEGKDEPLGAGACKALQAHIEEIFRHIGIDPRKAVTRVSDNG